MRWKERLTAILTSRWTERACMVVIIGCCASRTEAGYRAAILLATLPALLQARRAERRWSDTPEGREYARRTAMQPEKENKKQNRT